jgi:hypothetical protein
VPPLKNPKSGNGAASGRMLAAKRGLVKVNCQEWPLRITCSASRSHSFETRE